MVADAKMGGGLLKCPGFVEFVNRHLAECLLVRGALLSALTRKKVGDSNLGVTPPFRGGLISCAETRSPGEGVRVCSG